MCHLSQIGLLFFIYLFLLIFFSVLIFIPAAEANAAGGWDQILSVLAKNCHRQDSISVYHDRWPIFWLSAVPGQGLDGFSIEMIRMGKQDGKQDPLPDHAFRVRKRGNRIIGDAMPQNGNRQPINDRKW